MYVLLQAMAHEHARTFCLLLRVCVGQIRTSTLCALAELMPEQLYQPESDTEHLLLACIRLRNYQANSRWLTCQHAFVVLLRAYTTLQSTIDMLNFWRDSKEAREQGTTLIHPYNLGLKRNFQVIFLLSRQYCIAACLTYHSALPEGPLEVLSCMRGAPSASRCAKRPS